MDKIEIFFNQARKNEKQLEKILTENMEKAKKTNWKNGLTDFNFWMECHRDETCDMYTKPRSVKKGNLKVWMSNVWVADSRYNGKGKTVGGRYPVRVASMWYTPYTHFGQWDSSDMTLEEFYRKAEKEKVLYSDADVKISIIRRNAIPSMHSCQWCHKMSHPEYVMYINRQKKLTPKKKAEIDSLFNNLQTARTSGKDTKEIYGKIRKIENSRYYWHEVLHASTLKQLENDARHYFNDWY